jgi:hypothetical protein
VVLTVLELIGSIARRPTDLDRNAILVQRICHMQQFLGEDGEKSREPSWEKAVQQKLAFRGRDSRFIEWPKFPPARLLLPGGLAQNLARRDIAKLAIGSLAAAAPGQSIPPWSGLF